MSCIAFLIFRRPSGASGRPKISNSLANGGSVFLKVCEIKALNAICGMTPEHARMSLSEKTTLSVDVCFQNELLPLFTSPFQTPHTEALEHNFVKEALDILGRAFL